MPIPARRFEPAARHKTAKRVLVVTDDIDGTSMMIEHLRGLGLDVLIASYDGRQMRSLPQRAPAATLCFLTDFVEHGVALASDLRCHYPDSQFPILGRLSRESMQDHPYDSVLIAPVHPTQVAERLSSLIRLGQMEREILRRVETLQERFGIDHRLSETSLRSPFRVLFIGRAGPAYMAISNALHGANAEVVAAFTSFSAFDYLHEGGFDAVLINATDSSEPALTISDMMSRNVKLFHVPSFLLVKPGDQDSAGAALRRGFDDVIESDASGDEIQGRILERANAYRLHERLKTEFADMDAGESQDRVRGVFNAAFLAAHLRRVSRDCRTRDVPLSILTVKLYPQSVSAVSAEVTRTVLDHAVGLIAGVVRMQDIVCRVDARTVVVAFPEEYQTNIEGVAERIADLIENSAVPVGADMESPVSISVETAVVEQYDHDPSTPTDTVTRLR